MTDLKQYLLSLVESELNSDISLEDQLQFLQLTAESENDQDLLDLSIKAEEELKSLSESELSKDISSVVLALVITGLMLFGGMKIREAKKASKEYEQHIVALQKEAETVPNERLLSWLKFKPGALAQKITTIIEK